MRPTSLKDNLNSDFIQAYSRLLPKKAAKKVLVYVESYDITYPLFLWSVFFKTEKRNDAMNLNDFHNIIQIDGRVNIQEQGRMQLEQLRIRVINQIEKLKTQFPTFIQKVESLEVALNQLGVHRDNTYLFIQGHAIEDLMVLKFLDSVCKVLSSSAIRKIMTQAKDNIEKENEKNHYNNSTIEVRKALKINTEFKDCFLYKWIIRDLDDYIQKIKK